MGINKKSLKNLNPGIKVKWNGNDYKSLSELSKDCNIPSSTVQDYFNHDKPINGQYIDEVI